MSNMDNMGGQKNMLKATAAAKSAPSQDKRYFNPKVFPATPAPSKIGDAKATSPHRKK